MKISQLAVLALCVFFCHAVYADPVDCGALTTIGALTGAVDGCFSGDKLFSNFVSNINANNPVAVILNESGPGPDIHGWTVGSLFPAFFGPGAYSFDYTISVDLVARPTYAIATALTDVVYAGGAYSMTTTLDGGTYVLTKTHLTPADTQNLSPALTSFRVENDLNIASGTIISFTNSFTQTDTVIPEPMTMALLGSGLLGLGLLRRFRRG